jgi:hypothetical protein
MRSPHVRVRLRLVGDFHARRHAEAQRGPWSSRRGLGREDLARILSSIEPLRSANRPVTCLPEGFLCWHGAHCIAGLH